MIENCTPYVINDYDDEHFTPCKCPVCGGFLAWDELGEPICNKCGAELILVPEVDEETHKICDWGKICALSASKKKITRKKKPEPVLDFQI